MDFSSIRGLFTPSVLFVLLNVVVGAIAIASSRHRRNSHRRSAGAAVGGDHRPIARSSSSNVMERVRSLGLFRFLSGDLPPIHDPASSFSTSTDTTTTTTTTSDDTTTSIVDLKNYDDSQHQQQRQQFRRIQSEMDASKRSENNNKTMKKSVTEKVEIMRRPPVTVDEEVDAKADDFINRFRQQLKLQRLDSLS